MTIDVRSVAIRFADLWAVDPHQMVKEIYSADIEMENMTNPSLLINGSTQLHAIEDRLTAMIPEHRHELIRVIADGSNVACLETMIVSPTTHEYAPACLWWWLDDAGMVAAETGWFSWDDRSADSTISHGTVPPSIRAKRHERSWHETMARRYVHDWLHDPLGSVTDRFAKDCTFGLVGEPELCGHDALLRTRRLMLDEIPASRRSMELHRVVGEGSVVAVLLTISDSTDVSRGTVVLTFGDDDRIVSERSYLDWHRRVPRSDAGLRLPIGSPGWTLRD